MGAFTVAVYIAIVALSTYFILQYVEIDKLHPIVSDIGQLLPEAFGILWLSKSNSNAKLLTKQELLIFKYKYLAIAGEIYDVSSSKGERHYGKDGGYNFFTGIDGTKAFVSGDFTERGLVDDIDGLDAVGIRSIEDWKLMYEKDYKHVGKVIGNFYDADGEETEVKKKYNTLLKEAENIKKNEQEMKQIYPPCNAEFKNRASRVWCSNMSGAISRSWAGVPRKMFSAGGREFRCACIRTTGPPSSDPNSKTHNNRGDLDNPNLRMYDNCESTSPSCPL